MTYITNPPAKGNDKQIQFNNQGIVKGTSGLTWDNVNLYLQNNKGIHLGTNENFTIVNDGTDTLVTSAHGDLVFNNTTQTGSSIFKTGTKTSASGFRVQDSDGTDLISVTGDGVFSNGSVVIDGSQLSGVTSLTGLTFPLTSDSAANKEYVDSIAVSGVSWKNSVRVASTQNLSPWPPTDGTVTVSAIDGFSLTTGDRVLIKNQTTTTQNGIWQVTSGTWVRSSDAGTSAKASGTAVWVTEGTVNHDKGFVCTTDGQVTFGSAITFTNFSSAPNLALNNGLVYIGGDDDLAVGRSISGDITLTNTGVTTLSSNLSGDKYFSDTVTFAGTGVKLEDTGAGSGKIVLRAGDGSNAVTGYTITLPPSVGAANTVLTTNSSGVTSWSSVNSLGSNAAGSTNQIQYNSGGTLTASSGLTYNGTAFQVGATNASVKLRGDSNFGYVESDSTYAIILQAKAGKDVYVGSIDVNNNVYSMGNNFFIWPRGAGGQQIFTASDGSPGSAKFHDNIKLWFGTNGTASNIVYNQTNTVMTSNTGNLLFTNTNATGSTIFKSGTATSATSFKITDSADKTLVNVGGDSAVTITGHSLKYVTNAPIPYLSVLGTTDKCICVDVQNDLLYCISQNGRFRIYDINNTSSIVLVYSGTWTNNIYASADYGRIIVNGIYAYILSSYSSNGISYFSIFNVSNPKSPTLVWSSNSFMGSFPYAYNMDIQANYAYIGASNTGGNAGFWIVDISDPTLPYIVSKTFLTGQVRNLKARGNYLYVAEFGTALKIYDITNPTSISLLSSYNESPYNVEPNEEGTVAYIFTAAAVVSVDIRDKTSPILIQILTHNLTTFPIGYPLGGNSVQVFGNIMYVSGNYAYPGGYIHRIDISNPAAMVSKGFYTNSLMSDTKGMAIQGNVAYVAEFVTTGIRIFDIGGAFIDNITTNIIQTNSANTCNMKVSNSLSVFGNTVLGPTYSQKISSETAILKNITSNKLSATTGFNVASTVSSLTHLTTGMAIENNIAYLVSGTTLVAINVSDPTNLSKYSSPVSINYKTGDSGVYLTTCAVKNGYVYVAGASGQYISVYNATNPSSINGTAITRLGPDVTRYGSIRYLIVDGNTLYAVSYDNVNGGSKTVTSIDISTPSAPVYLSKFTLTTQAGTVVGAGIANGYLITITPGELEAVNISNPSSLTSSVRPSVGLSSAASAIVVGNYVYVYIRYNYLMVINVTTPGVASSYLWYTAGGTSPLRDARSMTFANNYIYVSTSTGNGQYTERTPTIAVFNVTTKTSPSFAYSFSSKETAIEDTASVFPPFYYLKGYFLFFNEGLNALYSLDNGLVESGNARITNLKSTNALTETSELTGSLKFKDSGVSYLSVKVPSSVTEYTMTLPSSVGSVNTVLTTNASGVTTWASPVANTSNQQLLFNQSGTMTGTNDLTWNGSKLGLTNNKNLSVGSGDNLTLVHDGTNSVITSTTGNLLFNNTNLTSSSIFKTGTTTNATSFNVTDSSDSPMLTVFGDSSVAMPGSVSTGSLTVAGTGISLEDTGADTDKIILRAGDGSAAVTGYTLTLPPSVGAANTVLTTNSSGVTSWSSVNSLGNNAAGSSDQIQYNSGGALAASSDFTWNGSKLGLTDNKTLSLGSGDDLTLVHDGSNSTLTSTTGDLVFSNTNATGSSVFKTGTDTNATSFKVTDSSDVSMVTVYGDSSVAMPGSVSTGSLTVAGAGLSIKDSNDNIISIQLPNPAGVSPVVSYTMTLPSGVGTLNTVLTTDASGTLSWSSPVANTSNTELLFNSNGTMTGTGNLTWDGTNFKVTDNKALVVGTDNDFTIVHDGSNSTVTSTTGNLVFDNTSVNYSTVFKLGTSTDATSFKVTDSSNSDIIVANGDLTVSMPGTVTIGDLSVTNSINNGIVDITGSVMTGVTRVGGLSLPLYTDDATSKAYVDSVAIAGVSWKNSVRATSTVNVSPWPPTDGLDTVSEIDGYTLLVDDRVLIKDQTTTTQNGIWQVTSSTWIRPADAATSVKASGSAVWCTEGTVNHDKGFVCTTDGDVPFGSSIVFSNFSSAPNLSLDDGLIYIGDGNNLAYGRTLSGDMTITNTGVATLASSLDGNKTFTGTVSTGALTVSSGSFTVTAGGIILSDNANQSISHTGGSGDLVISSGSNVVVDSVVFNAGAVSSVSTLDMSGTLTLSGNSQSVSHTGTGDLTIASVDGNVLVDSVTFNAGAVSSVSTLGMSGDLSNSAGDILLTSETSQGITHTGASGEDLVISSTNGNVLVDTVVFDAGAISSVSTLGMSGDLSNSAGDILLTSVSSQSITHTGASGEDLVISSTNGNVLVDTVVFDAGAVSSVSTLGMSGDLSNSAGDILLTSESSQSITHTGASGENLVISSTNGNVVVDTVTFNAGAVSSVSTLGMSGTLTLSGNSQSVSHTGTGDLTIASVDGNVLVDSVTFNAGAVSSVSTLGMSGDLSNSAGDILLTSESSQSITHTGASGENLVISSANGNVLVDNVVFNAGAVSSVSTLGMSDDLSNSAGNILLTSENSQSITHTGASGEDLVISSTNGNVLVDSVIFNTGAVSSVSTLDMSGTLTLSGNSQSVSHTGSGNLSLSSISGNVVVETVVFDVGAISSVSTLNMSGNFTNSGGDILLTSASSQSITHTGANGEDFIVSSTNGNVIIDSVTFNAGAVSGISTLNVYDTVTLSGNSQSISHTGTDDLTIASVNGNVLVDSVIFNAGAVSSVSTLDMSGTLTLSGNAQSVSHTGSGNLTIASVDGNVLVDSVVFNAGAVSSVSTLGMSGDLSNSAGDILLTSESSQSITHTGASGEDLVISSTNGNVLVDSVIFNAGAVSSVSTLDMSGTLTLSGNSQNVSHTGTGNLTIASVDGNVLVDSVVFNAGAVSSVSTLGMSGDLSNSAGNILLTSENSQSITHTGASGEDLVISSTNGNVLVDSVVFNAGAVSSVSTLDMSGTLTLSGNSQSVSHTGSGNLTIASVNGNVLVDSVVFNAGAVSSVSTLGMSDDLSNSAGNILLTSENSQSITHTGASGEDLVISSTNGNVLVDSVIFNAGAVSSVSTLDMSGILTLSGNSQSVSHTGSGNLTIASVNGNVAIESVSFNGQDVSNLGTISLKDSTTNSINIKASSSVTPYTLTLPPSVGLDQQVLRTDASGVLTWAYYGYGRIEVTGTSYTAGSTDDIIGVVTVSTPSTPVTVTLPVISGYKQYHIIDEGGYASINTITINPGSGNTINGLSSTTITADYNSLSIYNNGSSQWFIY
jgi:hypothetical protein